MEKIQNKNHWGHLATIAAFSVAAAALMIWGGVNANDNIDQLSQEQNYNLVTTDATRVAGVAVEMVEMNINMSDQTVLSMDVEIEAGDTVMDALQETVKLTGLAFDTTQYDFGEIVEQIGDLRGGQDNKYWIYYVNGESATIGADANVLNPGDVVEFKFEESIF